MNVKNKSTASPQELTTIARGAGIVFIGTIIGTGLKYLFELLIARQLGASLFGLFFLGIAVYRIGEVLATLGMQSGVLRYVAIFFGELDWKRIKGTILLSVKVVVFSSLITSITLIIFSKPISINIFNRIELSIVLKLLAIAIPFSAITTIFVFSFQAFKILKYKIYVKEIFEPLSRIILLAFIISLGWKLLGIIYVFIIPILLGTILSFLYLKKIFPQIYNKKLQSVYEFRKIFNFSWPLYFVGFLNSIFLWASTLLIGYFKTSQDVAIYNAAYRTALLGQVVLFSFNSIFAPIISDLFNRKEYNQLEKLFKLTAKWVFSFSFPLFLLIVIFAKQILLLFGKEFIEGAPSLIILSIAQLINSGTGSSGFMISMTGRPKINLFNTIFTLIINIILSLILIPKYGFFGAAIATGISISLINILRILEVYLLFKIHPYRIDFLKSIISAVISVFVLYLVKNSLLNNVHNFALLIMGTLTFIGVYGLILFLLGISKEERLILIKIKDKFI